MNKTKTNKITQGAVFSALAFLSIFMVGVVPGVELSLYALSSLFVGFMILENGAREGLMVYIVTILLAIIIMPFKLAIIPFVFFFGIYPFIKYLAEKLDNIVIQLGIKIGIFLVIEIVALVFFKGLFFARISLPDMALPTLIVAGVAFFLLYDYIFTLFINYYIRKRKLLKNSIT